jgi:hypothetical protein
MAIIPLKQSVTVRKAGASDGWGREVDGEEITLKARVVETTKVVTGPGGEEAVASLEITLDKLADVSYNDTINYSNELGVAVARRPLKIEVKRNFAGKPLLTVVYV